MDSCIGRMTCTMGRYQPRLRVAAAIARVTNEWSAIRLQFAPEMRADRSGEATAITTAPARNAALIAKAS